MKLACDVWHGYTRPKGEQVTPCPPPIAASDTRDEHGCGNFWVRDSRGQVMNVWECEVEQ